MSNRLYNQFSYSPERQPVSLMGRFTVDSLENVATLSNQGILYTAVATNSAGNAVTVQLIVPSVDGSLSIVTVGNAITVTLAVASGLVTTTADDLIAAINADTPATMLLTAAGGGSTPLIALATTHLFGGTDNSITTNAMNMSMTLTDVGIYTIQLQDEFPEVLSCQVSLMSEEIANLVPQIVSADTQFGTSKTIVIRTLSIDGQAETTMDVGQSLFVALILRNSSNP